MSSNMLSQDLQNVFAEAVDTSESAVLSRVGALALGQAKPADVVKSLMSEHAPEFQVVVDILVTGKLSKNLVANINDFVSLLVTFIVAPGICPAYRRSMIPADVFRRGLARQLLEAAKNGHIKLLFSAQAMFIEMDLPNHSDCYVVASGDLVGSCIQRRSYEAEDEYRHSVSVLRESLAVLHANQNP